MSMGDKKEKITDDTCKLYIGGINPTWSSDRIKEILEQHAGCDVMRVDVVKNFAFAFVENQTIGDKIIEKFHRKVVEDCKLIIQVSKNKQNLPDSEDLCFECGKAGHWAKECAKRRARMASRRGVYDRQDGHGPPPSRGHDPYYPPERRYPPPPEHRERDPYVRAYPVDPYARDYYARDPYYRDAYARDPYGYTPAPRYTYDYGRYEAADPYAPRAPASRDSLYAVERERVTYARSAYSEPSVARAYETPASSVPKAHIERDPYAVVSRRPVDPYEPLPRTVDPYATTSAARSAYPASSYPASSYAAYSSAAAPLSRSVDPYERTDRYASEPAAKRFPEPAYAPRAK